MRKNFEYRIYPTKKQARALEHTLSICKDVWNKMLETQKNAYKQNNKNLSKYELDKYITLWKSTTNPEFKTVYAQLLCNITERIDLAFQAFFRRIKQGEKPGYPRFKSKERYNSFTYPQHGFEILEMKQLKLAKIGTIRTTLHRPIEGKIKRLTIKRSTTNKWYAIFSCEGAYEELLPKTGKEVGIDMGLTTFATFSDGNKIKNPRFFKQEARELARVQRQFSKLKTEYKNPKRALKKKIVARVHERIKFKRQNFSWQQAKPIVAAYDKICIEDLSVRSMIENGDCAKFISDASWRDFLTKLSFKAAEAGKIVIEVNPKNTSKTCSQCGHIKEDLTLRDRIYECATCGLTMDRDKNAAVNILRMGLHPLKVLKKIS